MTLPSVIALIEMGIILVASILFGGRGSLKTNTLSEWSWAALLGFALFLEALLIVVRNHTLSNQMQWWIREARLSGFFVVFWIWLTYHFVLEPAVRIIRSLLRI